MIKQAEGEERAHELSKRIDSTRRATMLFPSLINGQIEVDVCALISCA